MILCDDSQFFGLLVTTVPHHQAAASLQFSKRGRTVLGWLSQTFFLQAGLVEQPESPLNSKMRRTSRSFGSDSSCLTTAFDEICFLLISVGDNLTELNCQMYHVWHQERASVQRLMPNGRFYGLLWCFVPAV